MYNKINKSCLIILLQYLSQNELIYLLQICKLDLFNKKSILKQKNQNVIFCRDYFFRVKQLRIVDYFEKTFFPIYLIKTLPIIKYSNRFIGGSDYIDSIRRKDLTSPIMVGIDQFARPFISIKYKCSDKTIKNYDDEDIETPAKSVILTVFQRYTDSSTTWCKAGYGSWSATPILYGSATCLSKEDKLIFVKNCLQLLSGEKVEYYPMEPQYNKKYYATCEI